jgi:hypothetical protein
MKTQMLPYIGIVSAVLVMLYISTKENIQYLILQFKNKTNGENVKFDFSKSSLSISLCLNFLFMCVIWAIYNNYTLVR